MGIWLMPGRWIDGVFEYEPKQTHKLIWKDGKHVREV